jgi:S-formylglutathione hydrolase
MKITFLSLLLGIIYLIQPAHGQIDQERLKYVQIESTSLQGNLLDVNTNKRLIVYLPPDYYASQQDYPVVYYLPGYNSPIEELIYGEYAGFQIQLTLDKLIREKKINPIIYVLCDGGNYLGGGFYTNSPLTGNEEDFIIKEVIPYVDQNFRTIVARASRGIAGHSMGGYGAFNLASKYPKTFGACYAMSPGIYDHSGVRIQHLFDSPDKMDIVDSLVFDIKENQSASSYTDQLKKRIPNLLLGSYDEYMSAFVLAYGAAFSFDTDLEFPHISFPALPLDMTTATNNWDSGFGQWDRKIKERKSDIQDLHALAFDCGQRDGWITQGTRYLIELMNDEGLSPEIYWHEGGHTDQLPNSITDRMIPFFSENLSSQP